MTHPLLRLIASAAGALALCAAAASAQAAPVTARFSGSVTGYEPYFLDLAAVAYDDDNPVGTAVRWDVSFDDSFLGQPWADIGFGPFAATGSMQVGSVRYALDGFYFYSFSFEPDFTTIRSYGLRVAGTPSGAATTDGAEFDGLIFGLGPDLSLLDTPQISYGYTKSFGAFYTTTYGSLTTSGEYSLERGGSVPEPATAMLALPALWWISRRRPAPQRK